MAEVRPVSDLLEEKLQEVHDQFTFLDSRIEVSKTSVRYQDRRLKQIVDKEKENSSYDICYRAPIDLQNGEVFLKYHNRSETPNYRHVWVSDDFQYIMWAHYKPAKYKPATQTRKFSLRGNPKISIAPVAQLMDVHSGRHTDVFSQYSENDERMRNHWVSCFCWLLRRKFEISQEEIRKNGLKSLLKIPSIVSDPEEKRVQRRVTLSFREDDSDKEENENEENEKETRKSLESKSEDLQIKERRESDPEIEALTEKLSNMKSITPTIITPRQSRALLMPAVEEAEVEAEETEEERQNSGKVKQNSFKRQLAPPKNDNGQIPKKEKHEIIDPNQREIIENDEPVLLEMEKPEEKPNTHDCTASSFNNEQREMRENVENVENIPEVVAVQMSQWAYSTPRIDEIQDTDPSEDLDTGMEETDPESSLQNGNYDSTQLPQTLEMTDMLFFESEKVVCINQQGSLGLILEPDFYGNSIVVQSFNHNGLAGISKSIQTSDVIVAINGTSTLTKSFSSAMKHLRSANTIRPLRLTIVPNDNYYAALHEAGFHSTLTPRNSDIKAIRDRLVTAQFVQFIKTIQSDPAPSILGTPTTTPREKNRRQISQPKANRNRNRAKQDQGTYTSNKSKSTGSEDTEKKNKSGFSFRPLDPNSVSNSNDQLSQASTPEAQIRFSSYVDGIKE